ncbi:MAG TPA: dTDP-4-dehydrorhamnose reductase [Burkholderiales bacterium]|nr:dTDP-4-dehydrorhamnose reductase [Burkholderiales bacterium]
MTRILLTGATGQVGWELEQALRPIGAVVAPSRGACDLARPDTLARVVDDARPDIIVNCAAYTAVDKAEQETSLAFTVNADAPAELAKAGRRHGALFVHYSTDYVFDGRKDGAYAEEDAPGPLGAYGRSKLAGEMAVRESGADYLVFRTSWVYGARGSNFLRTILRLALEREQLRVVADQTGAPTWSRPVAEITVAALQLDLARRAAGTFESAVLHLTAAGSTSWHGFASAIVARASALGVALMCREVVPIETRDYPLPAPRPTNSRLSNAALVKRYGLEMPQWETSLGLCLSEWAALRDSGARAVDEDEARR